MKTMKTKVSAATLKLFIMLFVAVGIQVSTVNAGTPKGSSAPNAVFVVTSLAPVVPPVADFNDMPLEISDIYSTLQPVAPKEASFDDSGMEISDLAPEVPYEAGYNDAI
jgi:hypothetical protein